MLFLGKFLRSRISKSYSTYYEIPERYQKALFLANASLFDIVNWHIHKAYEVCLPVLIQLCKERCAFKTDNQAKQYVEETIEMLEYCNSLIDIRFPIMRDNGRKEIVRGYRVIHGLYSGCNTALGGFRLDQNLTRDEIKALAAATTYQHACMGISLSGAHGGVKIDPTKYSRKEVKSIIEYYTNELRKKCYCNYDQDIIQPDFNTGAEEMQWISNICLTNDSNPQHRSPVVGKSSDLGGFENYYKAASQGIYFALDYFLSQEKITKMFGLTQGLQGKTYILQGLGKLGSCLAEYLTKSGAVCIGILEKDSHIYSPEGINIMEFIKHKRHYGSIKNHKDVCEKPDDLVMRKKCDILILAAQPKSLICYLVDQLSANIVVEGAMASITPSAYQTLLNRKKLVLPDIYVSAGSCVVSYLEYLKSNNKLHSSSVVDLYKNMLNRIINSSRDFYEVVNVGTMQKIVGVEMENDVITYAIEHVMTEMAEKIININHEYALKMDLKTASYINAIQNIFLNLNQTNKFQ